MHNKYIFTNIVGTFIFNEHYKLVDKILFRNNEQKEKLEKELSKKHSNLQKPEGKVLDKILEFFKSKEFFNDFYIKNLEITKKSVKDSVKEDVLIIQAIDNISGIDKASNTLVKRLREWYELYNPEFSNSIQEHEKFVEIILKKDKKQLQSEMSLKQTMGADLSKEDLEPISNLAKEINQLYQLRKKQEAYLENIMKGFCPNLLEVAGINIGAKLMGQAGSLKRLMLFPASTIQLLGAEKALFRHMKTKARSPKYGFLHEHPLISKNKKELHGKIARTLADKISIAVKVDYFKGQFIGDKLRKEVEDKFKKNN